MPELSGEFVCPECAARLRIHLRGVDSTVMNCPECHTQLQIEQALNGELSVVAHPTVIAGSTVLFPASQRSRSFPWHSLLASLLLVFLAAGGYWYTQRAGADRSESQTSASTGAPAQPERGSTGPQKSQSGSAQQPVLKPAAEPAPKPENPPAVVSEKDQKNEPESRPVHPFAERLEQLGQRVTRYREQQQRFPQAFQESAGPASPRPFSWLAGLDPALEQDQSLLPQWNLPWDAPLNDRFVRRRREDLLNPELSLQASPDRYPASHVVGIAGVGRDAADLPVSHPRAGIFGRGRSTRVEDVKDGLSQTMLAAGVTDRLAAWADGSASFRSLTMEPYINGPDGFGTGQKTGMYVLLADGSVRFLAQNTAPVVLRRLAAMADGLPLDENIPGEPGEVKLAQHPTDTNSAAAPPNGETPSESEAPVPGTPLVAEPELPEEKSPSAMTGPASPSPVENGIDWTKRLAETVLAYQLTQAAPLDEVLAELEALLGAPIEFDEQQIPVQSPDRKQPVTITGKNISYGDLLQEALSNTGLSYKTEPQRLLIIRP